MTLEIPDIINTVIKKLNNTLTDESAYLLLEYMVSEYKDFQKINHVLFKYKDYTVQNLLKGYGIPQVANLNKINALNINIAPKVVEVMTKIDKIFIISYFPGTKTGELIPFMHGYHLLSEEAKLEAFKDLQKILNAGLIDNAMLRLSEWYITPDTHKVMIPVWSQLRPIGAGESRSEINQRLYRYLFRN